MKTETCCLSSGPLGDVGVDFENNVIRGIVAAELGKFKTQDGSFDEPGLIKIKEIINSKTPVSFLGHPVSGNDVDRPYLGKIQNARIDDEKKLRIDLAMSSVAMKPQPNSGTNRSWGQHIMELANEDPRALGFSLRPVIKRRKVNGQTVWDPQDIKGGDVVREGDATNSFLSTDDSHQGTAGKSESDSPDQEDSQLSLDENTKSFIEKTVTDAVKGTMNEFLAKQEEKAEQLAAKQEAEQKQQELADKELKADLSTKAAEFTIKATTHKMPAEKVASLSTQIKEGKMTNESALVELTEFLAKGDSGKLDEGGGDGNGGGTSTEDKELKTEYEDAKSMGLCVGMSFEDFKKQSADNIVEI